MNRTHIFLMIVLCCISLVSCSNDEPQIPPQSVIVPPVTPPAPSVPPIATVPNSSLMKPAVVNIRKINPTGKSTGVIKRLVKTITYTANSVFDKMYKTKLTDAEYRALPTDNLYDPTEELLNVDTKKYDERIYSYNAIGNLEKITINNIAYPDYNGTPAYAPIIFEYTESGASVQIKKYQDMGAVLVYEYNTIGQIIKARELDGSLKYTFEYDEYNNITSKYFYYGGNTPQMHYTYIYYADNTYAKNWIQVNPDGSETKTSTVTYKYDKSVAGVYKNEAIYKILMDNEQGLSYLHITSNSAGYNPKYFYDADGYLLKYDRVGTNEANYVTLFIYE